MRRENAPVRRTYRFRIAGLVYLVVTAFLAIAAISSQNNLLFWCLGLALAGIAVSGIASGAGLVGVRAEREAIPDAAADGEVVVRYRIRNENRFAAAFALTVYEREPGRRRRATTPWQWFATRPVAFVACIGAGQTVVAEGRARALRRGRPEFTDFIIASTFPFGLTNKTLRFVQRRTSLVYPRAAPVKLTVLRALRSGGDHAGPSVARGGAVGDFYGIREYVPGDTTRAIAWRASARLGTLVVKQHARPAPHRLWVRLELEPGDDEESSESAISLAAGVLQVAADDGYAVGLLCPSHGLSTVPIAGRAGLRNALARLATIGSGEGLAPEAPAGPSLRDAVITVRARMGSGPEASGLVLAADQPSGWRDGGGGPTQERAGDMVA